MESEKSDSGLIEPTRPEEVSSQFCGYVEIPSEGFNCLYKAKRNGRLYVLKGLKAEYRNDATYITLLKKEFDIEIQLSHPNIVSVHSFEDDPMAGPCIVMDFVDGCTLRDFLKTNPKKDTRLAIVKELLSAMGYYHSLQVIHRDLKPDNILITRNGNHVKLIDFGLGDTDYHTVMKQPAGSDKYAAPEQKESNVAIDCRADIYAFGKILQQVFPNRYGRIVEKCTKENRDERYSCTDDIIRDLDSRKWIMPVAVTIITVAIAAVVFILFGTNKQEEKQKEIIEENTIKEDKLTLLCNDVDSIYAAERGHLDEVLSEGINGEYEELVTIHFSGINYIARTKVGKLCSDSLTLEQKSDYTTFCEEAFQRYFGDTTVQRMKNGLPSYGQHLFDSLNSAYSKFSDDDKYDLVYPTYKKMTDSIRGLSKQYEHIADSIQQTITVKGRVVP